MPTCNSCTPVQHAELYARLHDQNIKNLMELAFLTQIVYCGPDGLASAMDDYGQRGVLPQWAIARDREGGLLVSDWCAVFHNEGTRETVLATAGTASFRDLGVDGTLPFGNTDQPRFDEARALATRSEKAGCRIDAYAGHSLGGQISELLGIAAGTPYFSFNGPSYSTLRHPNVASNRNRDGHLGTYVYIENDVVGNAGDLKPNNASAVCLPAGHGPLGNHSIVTITQILQDASQVRSSESKCTRLSFFQNRMEWTFDVVSDDGTVSGQYNAVSCFSRRLLYNTRTTTVTCPDGKTMTSSSRTLTPSFQSSAQCAGLAAGQSCLFNLFAPADLQIAQAKVFSCAAEAFVRRMVRGATRELVGNCMKGTYGTCASELLDVASCGYMYGPALRSMVTDLLTCAGGIVAGIPLISARNNVVATLDLLQRAGFKLKLTRNEVNIHAELAKAGIHYSEASTSYEKGAFVITSKAGGLGIHIGIGILFDLSCSLMCGSERGTLFSLDNVPFTESLTRRFTNEFTVRLVLFGRSLSLAPVTTMKNCLRRVLRFLGFSRGGQSTMLELVETFTDVINSCATILDTFKQEVTQLYVLSDARVMELAMKTQQDEELRLVYNNMNNTLIRFPAGQYVLHQLFARLARTVVRSPRLFLRMATKKEHLFRVAVATTPLSLLEADTRDLIQEEEENEQISFLSTLRIVLDMAGKFDHLLSRRQVLPDARGVRINYDFKMHTGGRWSWWRTSSGCEVLYRGDHEASFNHKDIDEARRLAEEYVQQQIQISIGVQRRCLNLASRYVDVFVERHKEFEEVASRRGGFISRRGRPVTHRPPASVFADPASSASARRTADSNVVRSRPRPSDAEVVGFRKRQRHNNHKKGKR